MKPITAERRINARASVAYPVAIMDRHRRVLARGRTTDISQRGVFVVVIAPRGTPMAPEVQIEITVPKSHPRRSGRQPGRKVRYLARITRSEQLGQMLGLGVEFIEKLP